MENKDLSLQRTEEVQEIVEKMPVRASQWVSLIAIGLTGMLLLFGYMVKYPQVVSGTITITMEKAPVNLVAKNSGRIVLLGHTPRQQIQEGEIIAVTDNPSDLGDYIHLNGLLPTMASCMRDSTLELAEDLDLGELNAAYYQFVNFYRKYWDSHLHNIYELNKQACILQIKACEEQQTALKQQILIKEQQTDYYRREIARDSFCLKLGDFSARGLDKTRNIYNSALENQQSAQSALIQEQIRLDQLHNQLRQINVEHHNSQRDLTIQLLTAFNNLQAEMKTWKERYAIIAPFSGQVEFLGFWRENDFISAGTPLFSVVPKQNPMIGHMQLPSAGAGKVKPGQDVSIKLNDFPYLEYGTIEGKVETMSLVTNKNQEYNSQQNGQPTDFYLVTVKLSSDLKTKSGSKLEFRYEIKGSADIKTEKQRLIQRLFDNLRYTTQ